jgi:hypothetical protein
MFIKSEAQYPWVVYSAYELVMEKGALKEKKLAVPFGCYPMNSMPTVDDRRYWAAFGLEDPRYD